MLVKIDEEGMGRYPAAREVCKERGVPDRNLESRTNTLYNIFWRREKAGTLPTEDPRIASDRADFEFAERELQQEDEQALLACARLEAEARALGLPPPKYKPTPIEDLDLDNLRLLKDYLQQFQKSAQRQDTRRHKDFLSESGLTTEEAVQHRQTAREDARRLTLQLELIRKYRKIRGYLLRRGLNELRKLPKKSQE